MIKKIVSGLLITLSCLFLAACGGSKTADIEIKPLGNQMKYETKSFTSMTGVLSYLYFIRLISRFSKKLIT